MNEREQGREKKEGGRRRAPPCVDGRGKKKPVSTMVGFWLKGVPADSLRARSCAVEASVVPLASREG